jgi:hypothetical protein
VCQSKRVSSGKKSRSLVLGADPRCLRCLTLSRTKIAQRPATHRLHRLAPRVRLWAAVARIQLEGETPSLHLPKTKNDNAYTCACRGRRCLVRGHTHAHGRHSCSTRQPKPVLWISAVSPHSFARRAGNECESLARRLPAGRRTTSDAALARGCK